jgi:hypothetical protein
MGLVVEEQVELKVFQVQEEQAEGLLEGVDPEPGRQLEDVEVDWDTGENKIRFCAKHPSTLYYIP